MIYIDFKNNCSAIVNGTAPEDGDVSPKHVVWKRQCETKEKVAF
jgi:hypothetical protein